MTAILDTMTEPQLLALGDLLDGGILAGTRAEKRGAKIEASLLLEDGEPAALTISVPEAGQ